MNILPILSLAAASLLSLPPHAIRAAAPPNDDFANRAVLSGQAVSSTPVDVTDATREGSEPAITGYNTVWYTWTAPQDGTVNITTAGTAYDNILSVFNGDDLDALAVINSTGDATHGLTFPVKAGFVYQICVGKAADYTAPGSAVVHISNGPATFAAPVVVGALADANDNFASAQDLGSAPVVSAFGFDVAATTEASESANDGDHTLWWTWTAPQDGVLTVGAAGTTFDHALITYTGDSLPTLAGGGGVGTVDAPYSTVLNVLAGTTYRFVIGTAENNGPGTAVLNLSLTPGLAHVSIQAEQATVDFSESHYVSFILSYTGSILRKVKVNYKEKYELDARTTAGTGTKKIKPSKPTSKLTFPLSDLGGSEARIKVLLRPGIGYVVDDPGKAKVVIYDK